MHLDLLPAIPNREPDQDGILITDKDVRTWLRSHPMGYAEWFFSRMREAITAAFEAKRMQIHEVPEWQIKTTLHETVQALKRHRDDRRDHQVERVRRVAASEPGRCTRSGVTGMLRSIVVEVSQGQTPPIPMLTQPVPATRRYSWPRPPTGDCIAFKPGGCDRGSCGVAHARPPGRR
jgi:hypothetical protein